MATNSRPQRGGGDGRPRRSPRQKAAEVIRETTSHTRTTARRMEEEARANAARAEAGAARMELLADRLEALELWLRDTPGSRRPRWSREDIADAALAVVDLEGYDALSMRRLAAELGAGTMSLYHYVKTKDEVFALMADAVMGEILVPDEELAGLDWRARLLAIARSTRDAMLRHPWMLSGGPPDKSPPVLSPNHVRHFDQSLGAVIDLPIDLYTKLDIMTAVDEYVFGYCRQRMRDDPWADQDERPHHPVDEAMFDYLRQLAASGDYPALASVLDDDPDLPRTFGTVMERAMSEERFERNLNRLLTGIALDLGL